MTNHGWVIPNPNGLVARCGGPHMCSVCQQEFKNATEEQRVNYINKCIADGIPFITFEEIEKIERNKSKSNRDTQAALEGKRAWRNNIPITANPYSNDSSAYMAWQNSWREANSAYLFSPPEGL